MPERTLVYIKRPGEPSIPVTVRIEWLANGKIEPCLFWMPGGSCYEIKQVYECVFMAHLKESGTGIRFKIKAEVVETPEPYCADEHGQYEAYLYFDDNWFCGRDIIDSRYGHAGKEYIPVALDIFPSGDYELVYFYVKGELYEVERTIAVEPRGSFTAGGVGMWHKVEAFLVSDDSNNIGAILPIENKL